MSPLFWACNTTNEIAPQTPASETTKPALAARYFMDETPVIKDVTDKALHVHLFIDADGRENYHAFTTEADLIKWALSSDDESTRLIGEKREVAQQINKWQESSDFEGQVVRVLQKKSGSDDPEVYEKYALNEDEVMEMIPADFTNKIQEIDDQLIKLNPEIDPIKGGRTTGIGGGNWYDGYNYTGANLISGSFLTKPVGAGISIRIFGRTIWIVRPASWNDRISSLKYYTVLAFYITYANNWYGGQSQSFSSANSSGQGYPHFGVYNMDNKISSIL